MMSARARGAGLAAAMLLVLPAAALSAPTTTVQCTFQDCDEDNLLDLAFGERHTVVACRYSGC